MSKNRPCTGCGEPTTDCITIMGLRLAYHPHCAAEAKRARVASLSHNRRHFFVTARTLVHPQRFHFRCLRPSHDKFGIEPLPWQQRGKPNFGIDWGKDVDKDAVARINALPELARQKAYRDAAVDWIRNHPADFARGIVVKFLRYWNVLPNAAEFRSGLFPIISLLSFGPILPAPRKAR